MVNKNWSFEEAQAANQAVLEANPSLSKNDPLLPFSQWYALKMLDGLEYEYRARGCHKFYVMQAIAICAKFGLSLPSWASEPYLEAYKSIISARTKSWDEALGRPFPKNVKFGKLEERYSLQPKVCARFDEVLKIVGIKDKAKEIVAEEFCISKTKVWDIYTDNFGEERKRRRKLKAAEREKIKIKEKSKGIKNASSMYGLLKSANY